MAQRACIRVIGARQHNLKNIDVDVPRGALTVITGLSGSGKSSLAFDTIYAEGQRRYVESLSAHARQFMEQMQKPDVDRIEGLPPTIAIEQRTGTASPRSTVATTTEIHDFLRVLFARAGQPRCWKCDRPIVRQSTEQVVDAVLSGPEGQRIMVLAPLVQGQRGGHKSVLTRILKEGFVRARIDGDVTLLSEIEPCGAGGGSFALSPNRKHTIDVVVDRLVIKPTIAQRLADSVEIATRLSGGRVIVSARIGPDQWSDEAYSAALACPVHADVRLDDLSPQRFSFNSPHGACELCNGLGTRLEFDRELIVPDPNLSLRDGAIAPWRHTGKRLNALYSRMLHDFYERFGVLPDVPFRNIPQPLTAILLQGTTEEEAGRFGVAFEGVIPNLKRRWETTDSESVKQRLHTFLSEAPCERCRGTRLNKGALCVKIAGLSIADITAMTIAEAIVFFDDLTTRPPQGADATSRPPHVADATFPGDAAAVAQPLLREIRERLRFLDDVGVEYLTLDRASSTLSGGEWQRIRLGTQIGSSLSGVCYVLDEPTIGLHARDTRRLTAILKRLAQMDNTVVVVEHDEEIITEAAHVIDIGPGAGLRGGYLVAQGTLEDVLASKESITAAFLTGKSQVPLPEKRRNVDWSYAVELRGVSANNLKNINVRFPLGCLVCVTGVSGSGKSTLMNQVLLRALNRRIERRGPRPGPYERIVGSHHVDKVIEIDASPIGRTPRSNPATYVGVFDLVRRLYAETRGAKIRGYSPSRFSFNIKGGRCEKCEGQGTKRIAMHFLPDVFVTCGECGGKRYNRETLEVRYRGKTVADVLNMRIEEAAEFFENFSNIRRRLQALKDVGLGYMALGQASNTLSGGEAQRVKLAAELHRPATPRTPLAKGGAGGSDRSHTSGTAHREVAHTQPHTMYMLDEPTTGLHFADVRNLVTLLGRLVDRGHTVVVIEHNLDVIKVVDWIIDLGPEGGERGGSIVVEGTPEQVAACPDSYTGRFLKGRLAGVPPLQRCGVPLNPPLSPLDKGG